MEQACTSYFLQKSTQHKEPRLLPNTVHKRVAEACYGGHLRLLPVQHSLWIVYKIHRFLLMLTIESKIIRVDTRGRLQVTTSATTMKAPCTDHHVPHLLLMNEP